MQGTFRSHYVERRFTPLLSEPVISRGVIEFRPPDHLRKTATSGGRSAALTIDGEHLVVEGDDGRRELSTARVPGLSALMAGLAATAAGDVEALRERFHTSVAGDRQNWSLTLEPLAAGRKGPDDPSSRQGPPRIVSLVLSGAGGQLERIEWRTDDGERTVLRFTETAG